MALLGVIVLVLYPDLRRDATLLLLGVALVVTSWLDMAMAYAVQYARMDLTEGGLAWRGRVSSGSATTSTSPTRSRPRSARRMSP
jgi:uncharacterized membrane protein